MTFLKVQKAKAVDLEKIKAAHSVTASKCMHPEYPEYKVLHAILLEEDGEPFAHFVIHDLEDFINMLRVADGTQ